MTKNAAKRRRSGTPKVSRKMKNSFKFLKPKIHDSVVKGIWDSNLKANENLIKMGVRAKVNVGLQGEADASQGNGRINAAQLFDVPDSDDFRVVDRNSARRPMSDEDQGYIATLMTRHGCDYKAMARDIKTNYNQLPLGKLQTMGARFLTLSSTQRAIAIPDRIVLETGGGDEAGAEAGTEPVTGMGAGAGAEAVNKKKARRSHVKSKAKQ